MDDISFAILKLFSSHASLTLSQLSAILNEDSLRLAAPVDHLRKQHFLKIETNHAFLQKMDEDSFLSHDTLLQISFEGKAALEMESKSRKRFRFNELRAWITLVIAVLAFIKSFFF